MVKIGTNIASLTAQRSLNKTTSALSKSFERLSTGLRINRPGDDPAGLQVADQLKVETALLQTSVRNINDGVSAINILTAGLDAQKSLLFRMAELAEQSANGVFDYQQRKALDQEYQQLIEEFDRVAESTEFNGKKLLSAEDGENMNIMIGTDGDSSSLLGVETIDSHSLSGVLGLRSDLDASRRVQLNDLQIIATGFVDGNVYPMYGANMATTIRQVTDSQGQEREIVFLATAVTNNWDDFITALPDITTVSVTVYELKEDGAFGQDLVVFDNLAADSVYSNTVTFLDTGATADVSFDYSHTAFENIEHGGIVYGTPEGGINIYPITSGDNTRETAIGYTGIRYQQAAQDALDTVRNRLEDHTALLGDYGAIQSRLTVAMDTAMAIAESTTTAESRIRDADIAAETAELVRLQIIQQASAAVLGQANQSQAVVLQLLE